MEQQVIDKEVVQAGIMYDKDKPATIEAVAENAANTSTTNNVETKVDGAEVQDSSSKSTDGETKTAAETTEGEVKLDLKIPEGSHLTQATVDEIVSLAKEQGLSQEVAQKLLDREANVLTQFVEKQKEIFEQQGDEWYKEVEAHPVLGGDNLKQTSLYVKSAFDKFAPEAMREFFKDSPYRNNPVMVELFYNIGKAMDNDKLVLSGVQASPSVSPVDLLYDNTKK